MLKILILIKHLPVKKKRALAAIRVTHFAVTHHFIMKILNEFTTDLTTQIPTSRDFPLKLTKLVSET